MNFQLHNKIREVKIFYDFTIYIKLVQMMDDAEAIAPVKLQLVYQNQKKKIKMRIQCVAK